MLVCDRVSTHVHSGVIQHLPPTVSFFTVSSPPPFPLLALVLNLFFPVVFPLCYGGRVSDSANVTAVRANTH